MKILVVDDDVMARKVLTAFLRQSNFDVQLAEDARSAFRALTTPGAPLLAIVDWVLPDLSGPELCRRVRAHDLAVQPYLIMLSSKKERADVAAGLDAGADDYVVKPFNIEEMQARLRVGERQVEERLALYERIQKLESALRDQMLSAASSAAAAPATSAAPVEDYNRRTWALDRDHIDTVVAGALRHSGQREAPRRVARAATGSHAIAWSGLLLGKQERWFDLLLETDRAGLAALQAQSRNRGNSLADFCVKLQTAVRDSMHSVLRASGADVSTVFVPLAVDRNATEPADIPDAVVERHHYKVGSATLTFVVSSQPCAVRQRTPEELHRYDILARAYPPENVQRVPLLRSGVVLRDHTLEKLRQFAGQLAGEIPLVAAYTPSPQALSYLDTPMEQIRAAAVA